MKHGDGNVAFAPESSAIRYIESDDLLPLAVTGNTSSLAGPPGVDPNLLWALRAAFLRVIIDPEFIATASDARLDIGPLDGDAAAVEVAQSFAYYEKFKTNLANPHAP